MIFGWLALAAGLGHGLAGAGMELALAALLGNRDVPVPTLGLWLAVWGPLVEQPVLMVAYGLYPDGRLPQGWKRWAVLGAIGLAALGTLNAALDRFPGRGSADPRFADLRNPFSVAGASASADMLPVFFVPSAVVIIVILIIRWRQAEGDQRRVLSWIVVIATPLTILVPISIVALPGAVGTTVAQVSTLLEVAVIVAATLRHRVYGIEIVLNRTLVYTALTAVVALVYGTAVATGSALGFGAAGVPAFAGALAAALILAPARTRIQRAVNRFLYGDRDEPYAVLSQVASKLEAAGSAEQLLPGVVAAAATALRVPYVAVELTGAHGNQVIASGTPGGPVTRVPLRHQGRTLGALAIGRRPGEHDIPARERRLLSDLARQASAAAANVMLTEDLRRSRERIVSAREEERRRLRNDLHDGLGPQLTGIALGLDIVAEATGDAAPKAAAHAERLRDEVQEAIEDVRRLVLGLRPPRLDEVGLAGALREMVDRAERGGVHISVDVPDPSQPLPAAVEVAAYRIATEAITNVVRHADAATCTLSLKVDGDVQMSIVDDGHGLGGALVGVGRTSMRERAEELGGSCTIEDAVEHEGCRVEVRLPMSRPT